MMSKKTAMARHILVKHKDDAENIKQQLAKGGDFAKLAKKHSTCNSAKRGGDLGEIKNKFFHRGYLEKFGENSCCR